MIWLLACAAPTPQAEDAAAFARGECSDIHHLDLRAECLMAEASDCDAVPEGRWRNECWFVRAERELALAPDTAIASCANAGPFAGECWTHLFKAQTDPAYGGDLDHALATEATYPSSWRAPWGWWWRRHHEAAAVIAPSACDDIARDDLRRPCERSAPTTLALAWRQLLRDRPRAWCSRALTDVASDPYGKPWERSPELDAVVREELQVCEALSPATPSSG